jgi:hypothetical protein
VYDAISAEEKGVPAVALIAEGFKDDARSAASSRSMPGARWIPTIIPPEATKMEEIEAGVEDCFDEVINALLTPLNDEEKSPEPKKVETPSRIIFKGNLDDVNLFFYRRGWTDGFPVIPPTEEKVAEMLTGTDLPPDMLLGKLLPRMGKMTVEKIAVNAAMAGALPTHMPVILAAARLLLDSEMGFRGFCTFGVSTGSWAPFWVINGPIRNEINLNYKSGVLSPGNIANATIGRAIGLIIKNIGGVRKGIEDMGVMGNPMKYTMVMAENEEESPWEPMNTDFGFNKEDNTIAISFPQSWIQNYPPRNDDDAILRSLTNYLIPGMMHTVIFPPVHARTLAKDGWNKQDIKEFIREYARMPVADRTSASGPGPAKLFKGKIDARLGETVPIINDIRTVRVMVAGGPGAFIAQAVGGGPTPGKSEIRKIELPENWDKLVAKYKNIVPNHVRY